MKKIFIILAILIVPLVASGLYRYQIKTQVVSVGTVATKLPATPMVGRQYILIRNVGSSILYIGASNITADESSTGGIQILPFETWESYYSYKVDVYGIVASGTVNVIVEEGK